MILADLGGQRIKVARARGDALEQVGVVAIGAAPGAAMAEGVAGLVQAEAGPIWLCSSRPDALAALRADPSLGPRLRVVAPEDVPLARSTRGTGSDRLLAASAAWHRVRGACLIADCGTAWTLDVVDAAGCFRGGAIGPGLRAQTEALAQACPHLAPPAADCGDPFPDDTARAVAAGTRGALARALDGWAARWEETLGVASVRFLTGGDAAVLAPELGAAWQLLPDLVLEGLHAVALADAGG